MLNRDRSLGVKRACALAGTLLLVSSAAAQVDPCAYPPDTAASNLLPVDCGESVVTQFSGHDGANILASQTVLGIFDIRNPAPNGTARNFCPPVWHNFVPSTGNINDRWNATNLGQVFGVTLDDRNPPNIYVSATTQHGSNNPLFQGGPFPHTSRQFNTPAGLPNGLFGPGGSGAIYRISGVDGSICVFAQTAGGFFHMEDGTALGDLAFDKVHNRIFVSDFDSGSILCLDATACPGVFVSSFKHAGGVGIICNPGICDLDIGDFDNRFAPLGDRPFGLGVHEGRLYYGLWVEDSGRSNPSRNNEVWSIDVSTGVFSGIPKFEFSVPNSSDGTSNPVAGISFSSVGRMMVAERTTLADVGPGLLYIDQSTGGSVGAWAHRARELEYQLVGNTWVSTLPGREFRVGQDNQGQNASGGVDFNCDDEVISTGDYLLRGPGTVVYGLQITPPAGNTPSTVWSSGLFVDLGFGYTTQDKTRVGDVVINRSCCECAEFVEESILCEAREGELTGNYTYTFRFVNRSGQPIRRIAFPAGSPIQPSTITLGADVPNNQLSPPITVTITGNQDPGEFCFQIRFFNAEIEECCATEHCIDLPDCDCLQMTGVSGDYVCFNGGFSLGFAIQNLTGRPMNEVYLFPEPPTATFSVNPSAFNFPNFPHLDTEIVNTFVTGVPGGTRFCLRVSIHHDGVECCSEVLCFEAPVCPPFVDDCPPDFDLDGFVTGLDFDLFVYAFEAGEGVADFDHDGFITGLDFDQFVAAFEKGC